MSFLNVNAVTAKNFFRVRETYARFFLLLLPSLSFVCLFLSTFESESAKDIEKKNEYDSDSNAGNTPKIVYVQPTNNEIRMKAKVPSTV